MESSLESQYKQLVKKVLTSGEISTDRTKVGTVSLFSERLEANLSEGFPLITSKYTWFSGVRSELLWFLSGSTNIQELHKDKNTIWDAWADVDGNLGPIYGHQWRNLKVDQIQTLISDISTDPFSRRLIVSSWNVESLSDMRLYPCHILFQCYIRNNTLDIQVYQRSADLLLGVPFNIASYSLLNHILCKICKLTPGRVILNFGDVHIYQTHVEGAKELLLRGEGFTLPTLTINNLNNIEDISTCSIKIKNYKHLGKINLPVSV